MRSARWTEGPHPPHTLIVSPTSSGKTTLLYTLVAGEPGKVTVLVVSTTALQQEIVANGKKLAEGGVSVYDWKDDLAGRKDSWDGVEGLVVVQAETALGDAFQGFLDQVHIWGRLQRVVFDEVHLVLYWGETFRPRLTRLFQLKRSGLPFLCLTGTLPPAQEEYLAKRLEVDFSITYRFTAPIKNMRYTHEHLGSRSLEDAELLNNHVDQLSAEYLCLDLAAEEGHAEDLQPLRGIIFCRSIADVRTVYSHLQSNSNVQAYFYYSPKGKSDEESAGERLRVEAELADFCKPCHGGLGARRVTQWLVATSAAGVGVNLPNVQAVLIWGATHSLVDLVQMSGRAGRDHRLLPAATRIVTNDYYVGMVDRDREELEDGIQAMGNTRERLGWQHILADKQELLVLLEPQHRGLCLRSHLQTFLHSEDEADACPTIDEQLWCGGCQELTGISDFSSIQTQEEEAAAASARCATAFSLAPLQQPAASSSSSTSSSSANVPTSPLLAPAAATSPSQHDNEESDDSDPGMSMEVDEEWPQPHLPISAIHLAGSDGEDGRARMLEGEGDGPLQQDGPAGTEGPRALVDPGGEGGGSQALPPSCEASSFWSGDDDDTNAAFLNLAIPSSSSSPASPTSPTPASLPSGAPGGPSSSLGGHLPSSSSPSSPSAPPTSSASSGASAVISSSTSSGAYPASSASFPSGPRAASLSFPFQAPAASSSSSSSSSGACSASSAASSSASHIALPSSSSSSSSNSVPQLDFQARSNAMAAATMVFASAAVRGITVGTDGKKITACGLCLVKTGSSWGGNQPHDGGSKNAGSALCPLLRNVCFHCFEKYHSKGEDCKLKKVRETAQNDNVNKWCCSCLTKDDRRSGFVSALHADGFGFKCALGRGNTVLRACMALYEFKIETVNTIMGGKQKYRECFMKSNRILAESTGSLGKVKPNKESYVKWLHGAWMNGGNLSNAAVLFAGYFHYYKESDVLTQDADVWETLMSVPE